MTFDIGNNVRDHVWPCWANWKRASVLYFWFHQCKIITANQIVGFWFAMKISSLATRCQSEVVYFVEIRLITDTIIIICYEWIFDKWIFACLSFRHLGIHSWGWILRILVSICVCLFKSCVFSSWENMIQLWSELKSILGIVSNSNKVQTVFLLVVLNVKPHLTLQW